jgi:hypothetical protein
MRLGMKLVVAALSLGGCATGQQGVIGDLATVRSYPRHFGNS